MGALRPIFDWEGHISNGHCAAVFGSGPKLFDYHWPQWWVVPPPLLNKKSTDWISKMVGINTHENLVNSYLWSFKLAKLLPLAAFPLPLRSGGVQSVLGVQADRWTDKQMCACSFPMFYFNAPSDLTYELLYYLSIKGREVINSFICVKVSKYECNH